MLQHTQHTQIVKEEAVIQMIFPECVVFSSRTDGPRVPSRQVSVSSPCFQGWWEPGSESLGAEQSRGGCPGLSMAVTAGLNVHGALLGRRPGATMRSETPRGTLSRPQHPVLQSPRRALLSHSSAPRAFSWLERSDAPGLFNRPHSHPHPYMEGDGMARQDPLQRPGPSAATVLLSALGTEYVYVCPCGDGDEELHFMQGAWEMLALKQQYGLRLPCLQPPVLLPTSSWFGDTRK